jgi:hypothetical protein
MIRINMTRINALGNLAGTRDSVAWGKQVITGSLGNINALVFAAVLIVCSVALGCSSEQPKPVSSNSQIPITQPQSQIAPAPAPTMLAENKPAPKKVVRKKPATVNYTDKTYGVSFEYPRRYAIETGDAATQLVLSNPVPMNFVQPGGVALAAVELPETGFANTDFSSAFFDVSVHKTLTADQCTEFSVPQSKSMTTSTDASTQTSSAQTSVVNNASAPATPSASTETANPQDVATSTESAKASTPETQSASTQSTSAAESPKADATLTSSTAAQPPTSAQSAAAPQGSRLLLGDMELRATETVSGEGTRQSDSKYFHVFQNGSCYEFALNVTTVASQDGLIKHVNRDKVFDQLEKILATVKINAVAAPEVTAETPATPAAPATPAQ